MVDADVGKGEGGGDRRKGRPPGSYCIGVVKEKKRSRLRQKRKNN